MGGLVLVGDSALEDGLLDGVLDEPHLSAGAEGKGLHDQFARDGRLEVAYPVLLLDIGELLPNEAIVVEVLTHLLRVLAGDVGLHQEHEVVDVVPRLEEQAAHGRVRHALIDEHGGAHVQVHQLLDVVELGIQRQAQTSEDTLDHLHPHVVVVVEGPAQALVEALGAGLADVVQ